MKATQPIRHTCGFRTCLAVMLAALVCPSAAEAEDSIQIDSRMELFVDDHVVGDISGEANRVLHHPVPQDIVIQHDAPWEGNACGYHTIFKDDGIYRMYYKAYQLDVSGGKLTFPNELYACYAESPDGIHWTKPELGLFEFQGSKANNIVWAGDGAHDFTPFRDTNPDCAPEARYKAVGSNGRGHLLAFTSPDGIHWERMQEEPIQTYGAMDSQNLAYWDEVRNEYREYHRGSSAGVRKILTATSKDFVNWTEPKWLEFPGAPEIHLYINQVQPYYRAPHIFIGFPARYIEREWGPSTKQLPGFEHRKLRYEAGERYGTALTETLFMSSRDGLHFNRWESAFLRPGPPRPNSWTYGDNYVAWKLVETESSIEGAPDELSLYATEGYFQGDSVGLRRYTMRIDGFVSLHAPFTGGEMVTKPLVFEGDELRINFATSAAGSVWIELQEVDGTPIERYTREDCDELFGDDLDRVVTWDGSSDVGSLSGKPVRLRFVLKDADVFSYQFRD